MEIIQLDRNKDMAVEVDLTDTVTFRAKLRFVWKRRSKFQQFPDFEPIIYKQYGNWKFIVLSKDKKKVAKFEAHTLIKKWFAHKLDDFFSHVHTFIQINLSVSLT